MKNGWQTKRLGDVAEVSAGNSAPQDGSLFKDGTYPFFRTADAGRVRFGEIYESADYLNEKGIRGLRRYPKGTILFPKSGASTFLNHRVILGVEGCVSSHLATIVADEALIEPRFLLYFLSTIAAQDLVQDHAYPSLNLPTISGISIQAPPIPEQQRIIGILDEAFESISTAKANAEKNFQNAEGLFESQLYSEHAEKALLGDLVDIKTGKLDANAAVEGGKYPFFTCAKEIYAIDEYAFDCEAILLAGNNAVGDFNVKHYKGKFNAYQRTYVITVNEQKRVLYRFLYFQMLKSLKKFKAESVGAGTKFLKLGMIKNLEISLPNLDEQQRIVSKLDSMREETYRLANLYQKKLSALGALKMSLLHEAFSGKL
jgi:type I restriction enzyme, S subunit